MPATAFGRPASEPPRRPRAGDGYRALVDRLRPRGLRKEALAIEASMKAVGPSDELCRSFDRAAGRSPLHLVSAWVHQNNPTLGRASGRGVVAGQGPPSPLYTGLLSAPDSAARLPRSWRAITTTPRTSGSDGRLDHHHRTGGFMDETRILAAALSCVSLAAGCVVPDEPAPSQVELETAAAPASGAGMLAQYDIGELSVRVMQITSDRATVPSVSYTAPAGWKVLGGGATVNWSGHGNLLYASYPESESTWTASAKSHSKVDQATISIRVVIARLRNGSPIPDPDHIIAENTSADPTLMPETSVALPGDGWSMTGGGAKVDWSGYGVLLTGSYPEGNGTGWPCQLDGTWPAPDGEQLRRSAHLVRQRESARQTSKWNRHGVRDWRQTQIALRVPSMPRALHRGLRGGGGRPAEPRGSHPRRRNMHK
ncbi:hypothetical protein [Sorangium cellulosum]|uniref:DUF488 family protein, N3 subclade n=1 Tax=Sorangium cellulosum TaxID=56 RepID=UPI0009B90D09